MKMTGRLTIIITVLLISTVLAQAQHTIPASGGNATGSGGSVSYTVGQIVYSTVTGTNGSIVQGVQQPYEISVVTAIADADDIDLQYLVYPNPTTGMLKLLIKSDNLANMSFQLYDMNGANLMTKPIESAETEISLQEFPASIYFLKVIRNSREAKVFKIVKK